MNVTLSDLTDGFTTPTSSQLQPTGACGGASTVDLALSNPNVQGGTIGTDGLPAVVSGSPVHISVPISGSGFNSPETRTTTVTLQAGSLPLQSQTISLAAVQSTGTLMVPFNATFGPQDIGVQTITATVDPGNALNESNFSNNTASVKVRVIGKYKLVAKIQGSDGTWQDVPDSGGTYSAVPSDFILNQNLPALALGGASPSQPQKLQLGCVDASTYPPTSISGCQFQIQSLTLGSAESYSNGGHDHTDGRPFILSGTESLFAYDGAFHSVDGDGQALTYWPPIVAGDVVVNINGLDSQGNPIQAAPPITFRVKVPNLQPLAADTYNLKCAIDPSNSGCPGGGYQHQNFYNVTADVNAHMSKIGSEYAAVVPNDPALVVTDASLAWGGLYDHTDSWAPPHKFHRQGTDIDMRRPTISNEDQFESTACKNGAFPLPENRAHYHLFFFVYAGSNSITTLCN